MDKTAKENHATFWRMVSVGFSAMAGILCARNTLALWKSNSVNRQLRRALAFFTIIVGWIYITLIDVCIRQTPEEEDYFTVTETRLEPFGISFFIAGFLSGGFMLWRCRLICNENRCIQNLTLLFYIITVILGGAASVCAMFNYHPEEDWFLFLLHNGLWIYTYSFCVFNFLVTTSILAKTLRFCKQASPEIRQKLSAFDLAMESFAVASILSLGIGIFIIAFQYAHGIWMLALVMLQYFNIARIISCIADGTSIDPTVFETVDSNALSGDGIVSNEMEAEVQRDASSIKKSYGSVEP